MVKKSKKSKEKIVAIPFYWDLVSKRERLDGKVEVIIYNKKTGEIKKEVL